MYRRAPMTCEWGPLLNDLPRRPIPTEWGRWHKRRLDLLDLVVARSPIESSAGLATTELIEPYGVKSTGAISGLLGELERAGFVRREVRGKRTFRIEATAYPEGREPPDADTGNDSGNESVADVVPEPVVEPQQNPTGSGAPDLTVDLGYAVNLRDAALVAAALFDRIVVAFTEPVVEVEPAPIVSIEAHELQQRLAKAGADLGDVERRLWEATERNERLRLQAIERADETRALKLERDGLRSKVRLLEANVEQLKASSSRVVDGLVHDKVAAVMRERPSERG